MKPSTRNRTSSETKYQDTLIIPYFKDISEKFGRIGNRFNLRTIFKTKHTFSGTLMKTGPVREAQQTKLCVYSISCDCARCYIGETRDLYKYVLGNTNITCSKACLRNRINPTSVRRRPHNMLEWSEGLADWTRHRIQEIQGIHPRVSGRPSDQPGLPLPQQKSQNYVYSSVQYRLSGNICVFMLVP
jgi:hypothetical protein